MARPELQYPPVPLTFTTVNDLAGYLATYGIHPDKVSGKGVDELFCELRETDSQLFPGPEGPVRTATVVCAHVYCITRTGLYRLRETDRIRPDGTVHESQRLASLTEKEHTGEPFPDAFRRALREELEEIGRDHPDVWETWLATIEPHPVASIIVTERSKSYGLQTVYTLRHAVTVLPEEFFDPDGYRETREGTTSRFVWDSVRPGDIPVTHRTFLGDIFAGQEPQEKTSAGI